ncbi:MAG: universal stress protein [Ramlibacter sp.]
MTCLRSILVHLDGPERAEQRLALGARLAAEQGASLTVLYAAVPSAFVIPVAGESAALMAEALLAIDEEREGGARRAFEASQRQTALQATWIEVSDFGAEDVFSRCAMYADLVVLGQRDPDQPAAGAVSPHFVEGVLAQSGRPALVVPFTGPVAPTFERVAIAWKETAESARAVAASLPLLQRAAQVHVLGWGGEPPALPGGGPDLAGYLARHGVQAQVHHGGPEAADLGEQILSRCADLSADLLVMGCYGHSRAREWMLGGVSRTVLRSMTLPVLMAH